MGDGSAATKGNGAPIVGSTGGSTGVSPGVSSEVSSGRSCAVLIPAFNEAETVAAVVTAAVASGLGPVLVIDDGSTDATGPNARAAGAEVLELDQNRGKGGAVVAGAENVAAEVLVLLDADLTGLRPEHVASLAEPVRCGEADMTRGVFTGGRWRTTAAQRMTPQLNGQRAIERELLMSVPGLEQTRYGLEVALTDRARRLGWRCRDVALDGVSQIMKEEKRGWLRGFSVRLRMYADIVRTMMQRDGGGSS